MPFWERKEPPPADGYRQGGNLLGRPSCGPVSQQDAARTIQRAWRGYAGRTGALLAKHACPVPSRPEAQRRHVLNIARSYVGKLHWGNPEHCGGGYLSYNGVFDEYSPDKLAEFGYSSKRLQELEKLHEKGLLTRNEAPPGFRRGEIRRLPGMYGRTSPGSPQDVVVNKEGMLFPSPFFTWAASHRPLYRAIASRELAGDDPDGAMNCLAFIQWCFYQARLFSGRLVRHHWQGSCSASQLLPSKLGRIEETEPKPADLLVIQQQLTGRFCHVCFFERWAGWLSRVPRVIELSGASGGGRVYSGPLSNPYPGGDVFVADFSRVVERLRRRQAR